MIVSSFQIYQTILKGCHCIYVCSNCTRRWEDMTVIETPQKVISVYCDGIGLPVERFNGCFLASNAITIIYIYKQLWQIWLDLINEQNE